METTNINTMEFTDPTILFNAQTIWLIVNHVSHCLWNSVNHATNVSTRKLVGILFVKNFILGKIKYIFWQLLLAMLHLSENK